jgi:solute carrier family 39 (zinc transporter), member 9
MLIIEQFVIPAHALPPPTASHTHSSDLVLHSVKVPTVTTPHQVSSSIDFDAELADLESPPARAAPVYLQADASTIVSISDSASATSRVFPLTFGLVVHGLADGLALGVSVVDTGKLDVGSLKLSFVVFLALLIHKGQ